jgi:nifR3 family TIM-barrel protein
MKTQIQNQKHNQPQSSTAKINSVINFGFWKKVRENAAAQKDAAAKPRPIFVLAPLANVTDAAFRQIIAKYSRMGEPDGGPDVLWTEFVSADGLCSPGRENLKRDLAFSENEQPIVAQLFTSHPEKMREAVALCAELGFSGVDINMGCPDKSVEKQCAGAAMIKDPETAKKVIDAAREGAGNLPVSVKTRIGYNKNEIDTWIRFLLGLNLPVLTVHLRTRKEMSEVDAHWDLMPSIIRLRDEIQADIPANERTIILGNGDIKDLQDARNKISANAGPDGNFAADGVMFGRAIFGNPWLFDEKRITDGQIIPPTISDRLNACLEHTELFEKLIGDHKSFAIMKKHYKAYVSGWDGAKELRVKLMETENAAQVRAIIDSALLSLTEK